MEQRETPEGCGPSPGQGQKGNDDRYCHSTPEMSNQKGWIALHRQLIDSRVFQNEGLLKVWIWCLLKARHKPGWVTMKVGRTETEIWLETGQFVYGRKSAAKQLRMKPDSVRTRMEKLKNMQNITIDSTTHYSIITIVNWDTYQSREKNDTTENTSRTPAGHQPDTTNNNVNHVFNNENNEQQQQPGCGRVESSKKNNQSTDGLSEAQREYIDLRMKQADARGEIKNKEGYKAKLVSLARSGSLNISDLDSLRANFGDDWMPPMPQDDLPENHIEWTTSSYEPWDLLGMDRQTFTRDLEAGKIQFNSTDKSYGRDIGDSIHAAWPDGSIEHLPIPDSARNKSDGLDTGAVMSPKQKHNARVLQKVRNDLFGNAGRD